MVLDGKLLLLSKIGQSLALFVSVEGFSRFVGWDNASTKIRGLYAGLMKHV